MDPRRAPERVLAAYAANAIVDFARNRRSSTFPTPRFPGPEQAEAQSMPADDCLWFHNDHHIAPVR